MVVAARVRHLREVHPGGSGAVRLKNRLSRIRRESLPEVHPSTHRRGTISVRACLVALGEPMENIQVLFIEDDPTVQAIIDEALCDGGYEPAVAASGEEAITLLKGDQAAYRALVTDINLKGRINGWEVARAARETDPAFPVVYMTGAAADQWAVQGVSNSGLLVKPFAPAQLVTAISNLLNVGGLPPAPTT